MRQLGRLIDMFAFTKSLFAIVQKSLDLYIFALLSPYKCSKKAIEWTKNADDGFREVMNKLFSAITLAYTVENAITYLISNASNVAAVSYVRSKHRW